MQILLYLFHLIIIYTINILCIAGNRIIGVFKFNQIRNPRSNSDNTFYKLSSSRTTPGTKIYRNQFYPEKQDEQCISICLPTKSLTIQHWPKRIFQSGKSHHLLFHHHLAKERNQEGQSYKAKAREFRAVYVLGWIWRAENQKKKKKQGQKLFLKSRF